VGRLNIMIGMNGDVYNSSNVKYFGHTDGSLHIFVGRFQQLLC